MEIAATTSNSSMKECADKIIQLIHSRVDITNHLNNTQSVENKFNFLLEKIREEKQRDPSVCNVDQLWQKSSLGKDLEGAIRDREEGNDLFKKRQFSLALQAYNKSIFKAPCQADLETSGSCTEFALALANRAAVLAKFGLHVEMIDDLQLALRSGYPTDIVHKAFLRLSTAYMAIRDYENAKRYGERALKAISGIQGISNSSRNQMKVECSNLVKAAEIKTINFMQTSPSQGTKEESLTSHADIKYFSDCIEVREDDERGRFVTAGRDIEVGEVVSREESLESMLNIGNLSTHCSSCHKQVIAPLPCPNCQSVSFCSITCWKTGIGLHKWECWMSLVDVPKEESVFFKRAMLAYRLVAQNDLNFHVKNLKTLEREMSSSDDNDEIGRYKSIYRMVTHYEGISILDHIVTSIILLFCLEKSGYFGNDSSIENFTRIGYLLCHYYAIVKTNSHTISELSNKTTRKGQNTTDVGLAMFPSTAGHFNHSCDPNTFVVYVGKQQLTVAGRRIQLGEEVTHIYQGHYGDTSREKRRQMLQRHFHFWCKCPACEADFPDSKTLAKAGSSFTDATETQLVGEFDIKELPDADERYLQLKEEAEVCLRERNWSAALRLYKERSKLVSKYLKSPHILHLLSKAAITDCVWFLMGNRAVNFVPPTLQSYV